MAGLEGQVAAVHSNATLAVQSSTVGGLCIDGRAGHGNGLGGADSACGGSAGEGVVDIDSRILNDNIAGSIDSTTLGVGCGDGRILDGQLAAIGVDGRCAATLVNHRSQVNDGILNGQRTGLHSLDADRLTGAGQLAAVLANDGDALEVLGIRIGAANDTVIRFNYIVTNQDDLQVNDRGRLGQDRSTGLGAIVSRQTCFGIVGALGVQGSAVVADLIQLGVLQGQRRHAAQRPLELEVPVVFGRAGGGVLPAGTVGNACAGKAFVRNSLGILGFAALDRCHIRPGHNADGDLGGRYSGLGGRSSGLLSGSSGLLSRSGGLLGGSSGLLGGSSGLLGGSSGLLGGSGSLLGGSGGLLGRSGGLLGRSGCGISHLGVLGSNQSSCVSGHSGCCVIACNNIEASRQLRSLVEGSTCSGQLQIAVFNIDHTGTLTVDSIHDTPGAREIQSRILNSDVGILGVDGCRGSRGGVGGQGHIGVLNGNGNTISALDADTLTIAGQAAAFLANDSHAVKLVGSAGSTTNNTVGGLDQVLALQNDLQVNDLVSGGDSSPGAGVGVCTVTVIGKQGIAAGIGLDQLGILQSQSGYAALGILKLKVPVGSGCALLGVHPAGAVGSAGTAVTVESHGLTVDGFAAFGDFHCVGSGRLHNGDFRCSRFRIHCDGHNGQHTHNQANGNQKANELLVHNAFSPFLINFWHLSESAALHRQPNTDTTSYLVYHNKVLFSRIS